MEWPGHLFDTWAARGGLVSGVLFLVRLGWWLWRRRSGAAPPLFGWIGTQLALNSIVITQAIQLRTLRAKVIRLEAEIQAAEIRPLSTSHPGDDSSFVWPESDLMISKRRLKQQSSTTSEKPDDHQR